MKTNDAILAVVLKQLRDLRAAFVGLSKQPGPAGTDGIDGRDGVDGKPGQPGADGVAGADGRPGRDGDDGRPGRDGDDGKDGERGPMPDHEWRGSKLRFQKPEGVWGKWVDLRGPKGDNGRGGGVVVAQGGGGFDLSQVLPTDQVLPSDEVLLLRAGQIYRVNVGLLPGGGGGSGDGEILTTDLKNLVFDTRVREPDA